MFRAGVVHLPLKPRPIVKPLQRHVMAREHRRRVVIRKVRFHLRPSFAEGCGEEETTAQYYCHPNEPGLNGSQEPSSHRLTRAWQGSVLYKATKNPPAWGLSLL